MYQSNAIQAFVAFALVPRQLAEVQAKAHLAVLVQCPRSVKHVCQDKG